MRNCVLLAIVAVIVAGCGGKDDRGLNYMPDMYDSPAKKSQESFVIEAVYDDQGNLVTPQREIPTMLQPPAGSVSRDFVPYDIADTPEGLEQAKLLTNPVTPSADVLKRGRDRYNIYCAVCHGKDGNVANSYVAGPKGVQGILSINTGNVANMTDGHLYHIITHGRGRMPQYAAQLLPEDRWATIHYLRALGVATNAKDAELKELEKLQDKQGEQFENLPQPVPEYEQKKWPEPIQREGSK